MKKQVAFFDFDGTLTVSDTFLVFARRFRSPFRIAIAVLLAAPAIVGWKLGLCSNSCAKQRLFSALYKGVTAADFNKWGNDFVADIERIINPEGMAKLRKHLDKGDRVYIVSASMKPWIAPWAAKYGITGVIATEPEVDSKHTLTGRFATPNCHGAEKVVRIKAALADVEEYETWAYGDSSGDKEMFEFSTHHYLITHAK